MSNIDWARLVTKAMSGAALAAEQAAIQVATEEQWQRAEMESIAGQLLALEDGDPSALPGTDRAWRDYRIQVCAWKEGGALDTPIKASGLFGPYDDSTGTSTRHRAGLFLPGEKHDHHRKRPGHLGAHALG